MKRLLIAASLLLAAAFTAPAALATRTLTGASVGAQSSPNPVNAGGSVTYTITTTWSGATNTCTTNALSISGLPAGATGVFNPTTVTNAAVTSTLTISTTGATPAGTTSFTVTVSTTTGGGCATTASFSPTGSLVVAANTSVGTTTTTTSSVNPSLVGQSVTFTAKIAPASGAVVPTGNVQFQVDAVNFGAAVAVGSCAPAPDACATSGATTTLTAGNHVVSAAFTPASPTGTVTFTVAAGPNQNDTIVVGGITYTWRNQQPPTSVNQIFDSTTNTAAAANLVAAIMGNVALCGDATCINAGQTANANAVATVSGNVVTITNKTASNDAFSVTFNGATTYTISPASGGIPGGFGSSSGTLSGGQQVNNPVPAITTLSPPSAAVGSGAQTLTINGSNFLATSTATYNGVAHTVTFINSGQVTIPLTAGDVASAGSFPVIVTNPAPGGGASNTVNFQVTQPPTIAKVFNPTTMALSGTSTLTITITNPSASVTQGSLAVTDTFPAGLIVATPNGASDNGCGGTYTATAGAGSVSLSGGSLGPSATCTLVVNVAATSAGSKANTSGAVTSNQGTGNTAAATLLVIAPPTATKAFAPASMAQTTGTSTLTITISNPAINGTNALTGVAFSDTFPGGMLVAGTPNATNTCGGTFTATAATNNISLSGGTVAGSSGSCAVSVSVADSTSGVASNTTTGLTSTNGGNGTNPTGTIAVEVPPTITKVFAPTSITPGGTSTMTITITNPAGNTVPLTGLAVSDSLPTNVVVSTPNGASTTCGGTLSAVAASGTVSLTNGTANNGASCSIIANVTSSTVGSYLNTTGNVSATNGGTGGTASATLTVAAPPTITKAFAPATIPLNGTSTLTLTITNPATNTGAMNGIQVSDTFPAGMQVAATPNVGNTCGGTFAPVGGNTTITLTGGTIATPGNTCAVNVDVTATTNGAKLNTTGAVSSTNDGTGVASNTATLTVVSPPSIAKAFNPTSIPINGTSTLTFTLTNPAGNTVAESGVAFSDTFPSDLVVAATPAVTNTCGGSVTGATANSNIISLSGGTINTPAGTTCTISVAVTAPTAGAKANTTGTVSSTNGGTNATTASATLNVLNAPTVTKTFAPAGVPVNTTSLLTITITNPNTTTLTGVTISDTFPTNVIVQTPNGASSAGCTGGTLTATAGSGSLSLSASSVANGTPCVVKVNVKSATPGTYNNTTGNVNSTNGGQGGTASATLNVNSPPTIAKAFNPTTINVGGTSTLTITITNPNNAQLTGISVTDTFPSGVQVASVPNVGNDCGATLTGAGAGSTSLSLTNITLVALDNCTVNIDVTATTGGSKVNTTGNVSSTEGGAGGTATTTLTVDQSPSFTSAASTTFVFGASNTFPVTASGFPAPTFSTPGPLPTGVTLSSAGSLSGTPTAAGVFTFTITATNGISPDATQSFTLTVITQANYTQPFNSGHNWTWTPLTCTGGTCSNNPTVTSGNCGPPGVGNLCVTVTNSIIFNLAQSMTGYFHNPAGYTWLTLGVPANTTVTSVQAGFFDHVTTSGSGCNGATASLLIFDGTNTNEISATPIIPQFSIQNDTSGFTYPIGTFPAVNITSSASAASGITIQFHLNPSVPTALAANCTLYGDNINLAINYTLAHGKRGQVIIGINRQLDGTMAEAWAYNVEYLNDTANPLNMANVKFVHDPLQGVSVDASTLEGEGRKVTKIKGEANE